MKKLFFLLSLTTLLFPGCKSNNTSVEDSNSTIEQESSDANKGQAFIENDGSTPNILQIAIGSKDHTTLVAAVQAAELENVLVNAGPLTVFAPTNEAFAALPEGTVENLLKPENKAVLADIIKYHATPGNLSADFLKNFKKLGMANDKSVTVEVVDGVAMVGGAKILGSVPAGNGIVHVIDKVLLPPSE
jgi:uncharacterized surface protein with fasciclin (FAS1) repeats